jgi:hypothetical protein
VRRDPAGEGRLPTGRRPDQGMAEDHTVGGHVDESVPLSRLEVARVAPEFRGGCGEGRHGGAVVGRGQQQDRSGRLVEGAHLPAEVLVEPSRGRQRCDPDGYVAWIGEHQPELNDHLTRWFGKPANRLT